MSVCALYRRLKNKKNWQEEEEEEEEKELDFIFLFQPS
jgi:hypothetical protein